MKAVPTRGFPISADTPAAPPPTAAGRMSRRNQRLRSPRKVPAATPRCAAGDSVPIGAPSPTVATIATTRGGASRQGNRSSSPAVARTSAVRSARMTCARGRSPTNPPARALALAGRLRNERLRAPHPVVPVQHQHGERQADERHDDDDPGVLPGDDHQNGLDEPGDEHGRRRPCQSAEQPTRPRTLMPTLDDHERGSGEPRFRRVRLGHAPSVFRHPGTLVTDEPVDGRYRHSDHERYQGESQRATPRRA